MKKLEENIESKLTNYLNNIYDDVNDFRCELSDDGCKLKIISNGGLTGHEILPEYVENIEKITNSTYQGTTIISGKYQMNYKINE